MSDARLDLTLQNQRDEVARMAVAVDRFARDTEMSDEDLHNIHLILDELVINVIKYAFHDNQPHTIGVTLALSGRRLTMTVEDDGASFDPTAHPEPDLEIPIDERPIGGLGIHIVRSLSDSVTYRRNGRRNTLTVVRTVTRG